MSTANFTYIKSYVNSLCKPHNMYAVFCYVNSICCNWVFNFFWKYVILNSWKNINAARLVRHGWGLIMKKTVIVTGSSKGIGAATAILFAQSGWNVVINYNESFESANLLCRSLVSNGYSAIIQKANVAKQARGWYNGQGSALQIRQHRCACKQCGSCVSGAYNRYRWDRFRPNNRCGFKGCFQLL